ncbi:hypothetical protein RJT34_26634 [Clitoria ternatea]|uniref:Uncharacterized protein n=1 Tax=Clitoria ternatea TaxID=43366 RepID=A0AAN9IBP1_CLITE
MARVTRIQELPFFDSDKRKKIDGSTLFSNVEAEDAKDKNIVKKDMQSLESEIKYDLRQSLAWDSAFSTSAGILEVEVEDLFNASNSWHSETGFDIEDQLLSIRYMKPEFNLRKSLAWDSAFFTSEGVLNLEELSLVNKGFKKSEMDKLPRIEELQISSESSCTIESDGSSLTSFKISAGNGISVLSSPLKPSKMSRRVRNAQTAPTKKVSFLSSGVNGKSKVKATSGKYLVENSNMLKTCSDNCSCTTPTSELSSFSSQCCMNASKDLRSPNSQLSTWQSSFEFSIVKSDTPNSNTSSRNFTFVPPPSKHRITNEMIPENCYSTYSSLKKNSSFISPSVSMDRFSLVSSTSTALSRSDLEVLPHGESNVSHDDKGIMCSNPSVEAKGSKYISFESFRSVKPSCLRMPSSKIGYFDVDNSLLPIDKGGKKSHSNDASKTQILKDVRNEMTCPLQTRKSTISRTVKFGLAAVSKAGEGKDYLRNGEQMANVRGPRI